MQEVGRRIERIDVPGVALIGPLDPSALLQDEAIARTRLGEFVAKGLLSALISQTDKVTRSLHRHLQFADLAEIAFEAAPRLNRSAGHYGHQSGSNHGNVSTGQRARRSFMEGPASRQPAPWSVDVRNETPGAGPIGVVFGAEVFAEQPLLSLNAGEQDTERQYGDDDAHP